MKYFKKILAVAMALAMVFSLASCKKDPSQGGSEIDNAMTVAPIQVSDPDRGEEKIKAAASNYDFVFRKLSVDRSYAYDVTAKEIASAKAADMLLSNQVSVASLNLEDAVRVAAQTDVIFLAATTETRLSLVTNDENVKDIKGLRGKTVYCGGKDTFAQTVTEKIFDDNGVNAELVFLSDSEVIEKVKNNESDLFILQEPEGLVAIAQNENYIRAFELTEYWKEEFRPVGRCVVVKADFAKAKALLSVGKRNPAVAIFSRLSREVTSPEVG